jgi:hypothetical protein
LRKIDYLYVPCGPYGEFPDCGFQIPESLKKQLPRRNGASVQGPSYGATRAAKKSQRLRPGDIQFSASAGRVRSQVHQIVEDRALAHRIGAGTRPYPYLELGHAAISLQIKRPGWVIACGQGRPVCQPFARLQDAGQSQADSTGMH